MPGMELKDIVKKVDAFNKRWGIVNDSTYLEEFNLFRNRALNILNTIDQMLTPEASRTFCTILGIRQDNMFDVKYALAREYREMRYYLMLQVIFDLPFTTGFNKGLIRAELMEAIEFSKINLAATVQNGELILYPRGEKELDVKLVDEVLSFLNNGSQKHFIGALKFYESATPSDAIKSAESLRRSLEEFLRFKLQNQQGLAANIQELSKRLKLDKKDPIVRNKVSQIFSLLDQYFNENSKHKDGDIDKAENEYLIYQVGLLMRYVNNIIPAPLT